MWKSPVAPEIVPVFEFEFYHHLHIHLQFLCSDHNLMHEYPSVIIIMHNYLCIYLLVSLFDLISSEQLYYRINKVEFDSNTIQFNYQFSCPLFPTCRVRPCASFGQWARRSKSVTNWVCSTRSKMQMDKRTSKRLATTVPFQVNMHPRLMQSQQMEEQQLITFSCCYRIFTPLGIHTN